MGCAAVVAGVLAAARSGHHAGGEQVTQPVVVCGWGLDSNAVQAVLKFKGGVAFHVGDHHKIARDRIVAVVDTDPDVIMEATARGVDGIVWDTPDNQQFSWHFRATRADIVAGLERRITEWKGRRTA